MPEDFAFLVYHECAWGCQGAFVPSRYNSSRAKCIKCDTCGIFFSPNKFIFHSHKGLNIKYIQPDAANFNSWRRHLRLAGGIPDEVIHAWEDVKSMFNGGTRKRISCSSILKNTTSCMVKKKLESTNDIHTSFVIKNSQPFISSVSTITHQVSSLKDLKVSPSTSRIVDYVCHQQQVLSSLSDETKEITISPYIGWLTKNTSLVSGKLFSIVLLKKIFIIEKKKKF